ncbi:MAG: elongation factor 1-beta [Ignisphaera sp.]|uniref:Elongation factor 1-beta n=1 Tax=Ignisphaera aggregans TaxID=334771 RepID=A0A7C4JLJ6_9CREN
MPAVVLVVIRAYPKELLEKFDDLVAEIDTKLKEKGFTLMKWEASEIAFGYKALDLYIIMPEEQEGGTDIVEETIKSVEVIDNVDVIYLTRLST